MPSPVDAWYEAMRSMTPPQRRITDREDSMERAFALLRDEMREGFSGIARRLDSMNGRVNDHGEAIAALKTGCMAHQTLSQQVAELSETVAAHRARCPYDSGGDLTATTAPRWTNAQLAGGVAGGGAAGLVLLEVIKWLVERRLP